MVIADAGLRWHRRLVEVHTMVRRHGITFLIGLWLGVGALGAAAAPPSQRVFASADAAVEALVAANRDGQLAVLARILGPGGAKLVRSGDPVADRNHRARFVAAYDAAHRIEFEGDRKAVLVVGSEEWPLPIPLVRSDAGWRFDAQAAEQEILNRRVGRNELNVIEVCRAYVEAQREYAALNVLPGGRHEYAQRFNSRAGQRDGLYWTAKADEPQSPLGPLVAQARAGGYGSDPVGDRPQPYHGYYFRILTGQGAHAPGGAKNFVVDGHMVGGYALVAYPARYADSGVMTFIVSQDGIVYEKNLGPDTESLARRIEQFDPDASWHAP
jgi:hypothetical protein